MFDRKFLDELNTDAKALWPPPPSGLPTGPPMAPLLDEPDGSWTSITAAPPPVGESIEVPQSVTPPGLHVLGDDARMPASKSGRRRLAGGALVLLAVAGGTVGGAIAGRRSAPSAAPTPITTAATGADPGFSTSSRAAEGGSKTDVSGLVASALPSVVSIQVELPGGSGAGTGFIISTDGEIATNAHVVADATKIDVMFSDKSTAVATVLGVDRTDDLAVIKVDKTGLAALQLGDSKALRMGQPVVAIGNALALTGSPTTTEGIVSALDRTVDTQDGEHLVHMIQTDAAINPGNSGGPLLTLDGKVVGINSAGSSDAQNIGFAIAIDTAKPIIEQLQQGKTISKAFLGVATVSIDQSVAQSNGLDVDHGLLVTDVTAKSAASSVGLQAGDVIVSANGTATDARESLVEIIQKTGAGNTLDLVVHRDGKDLNLSAVLSAHVA